MTRSKLKKAKLTEQIFSMISGLINYGLGHNSLPKQWQALYYFCGAVTIAWSVPIYFLMPTSPLDAGRFFNEREKEILRRRFQENPLCRDRQPFIWSQFKEAMLDWKTYLYLVMSSAIYVSHICVLFVILLWLRGIHSGKEREGTQGRGERGGRGGGGGEQQSRGSRMGEVAWARLHE